MASSDLGMLDDIDLTTENVDLDDVAEAIIAPTSPLMKRSPSGSSTTSARSDRPSGASKVRAAAAMWEKPSSDNLSPVSPRATGRKRSGTVARPNPTASVAATASRFGARTGAVSPGPSPVSPGRAVSPSSPPKGGLKPLRLGARGPQPEPPILETEPVPIGLTTPEPASSLSRSPLSEYDSLDEAEFHDTSDPVDAPSALGLSVTPKKADSLDVSPAAMVASPVDLSCPVQREEVEGSSPHDELKPALPASVPLDAVPLDSTPEEPSYAQEQNGPGTPPLRLDTIDLSAPSPRLNESTATLKPSREPSSHDTHDRDGATEPETIVTPASPVHVPTLSPQTPPSAASAVSGASALTDVPLTPSQPPANSPVSPGQTRMASLFTRVLDYGKQTHTPVESKGKDRDSKSPSTPDEKKLPEPPKTTTAPSGKSFFTSASSFAFNLPSLPPLRPSAPSEPATSPQADHAPTMGSTASLNEPKAATSTWRATMTNFLQSRASAASTAPSTTNASNSSSSTNLLLHRLDDPTSVRDRRISREYGGGDKLREGFDRVRNEMEGAARDIRREIANGDEPEDDSIDWTFWGSVVQDYEAVARERPKELSKAIQHGIPAVIRGPIWQLMSSSKSTELEETFKALLKLTSPHEKAIHKDISRTFPNHKFFKQTGQGQDGLFMVVKAFSLYDREVGYTQGLAFIVAVLLLNMPDEEAFCVLVRLMDSYNLRSHYLADMPGLQLRLYQFDRLLEDVLPLLHNHLTRKGVKTSMYASQWLMTLFSYRFPLSLVYRVFDIVLAEGIEAIFRFAIALLKKSEDELLKLEFEQILTVLQGDLFEAYRSPESEKSDTDSIRESEWLTNDFVRDAYAIHITPLMLDQYQAEWEEKCRAQTEHMRELDQLRNANRHLSSQVKTLESSLAAINQEHVDLVRELVLAKIAKEDMENELVKYKAMCARLSQQVPDEESSSGIHASLSRQNSAQSVYSSTGLNAGYRSSRGASPANSNSPAASPRMA